VIAELPLRCGTRVVAFTDGVWTAGQRYGSKIDLAEVISDAVARELTARQLAEAILEQAVALDQGRPADDVSVLVLHVVPNEEGTAVRRMTVSFPVS
jgi:serine phosphatase RsbU (regulator of sigma subunit)